MTKWTFVSKLRLIITGIVSILLVFYAFNFVPRNSNIVASRTLGIQVFDYVLNFIIFFVALYLISCLLTYIYQKLFTNSK